MPLLLIIFLVWLFWPQGKRKRKTTIKYTVSDPVKVQREQIRLAEQYRKADERERKAQEQAEKREREREQAADDIQFLNEQLAIVQEMLQDTEKQLAIAKRRLERDKQLNEYAPGAVTEKQLRREQAERDKLSNKVIVLRARVHTINTRRGKAYYKLDN